MKIKSLKVAVIAAAALALAPVATSTAATQSARCNSEGYSGFNRVVYTTASTQAWRITNIQYNFQPASSSSRKNNQNFNIYDSGKSVTGNQYSADNLVRDAQWHDSRSGIALATTRGRTQVYFYDIFDVPSVNDPECGVYSPTF